VGVKILLVQINFDGMLMIEYTWYMHDAYLDS